MAFGLFASLLIGTIFNTLAGWTDIAFFATMAIFAKAATGPAIGVAVAHTLKAPPLVLYTCAAVGFAAPILRNLIFTMPRFPQCWAMAAELAVYGLSCGILYKLLPKKIPSIYISLAVSMVLGRVVWGLVQAFVITKLFPVPYDFTLAYFWTEGFVKAVPGMIVQIVLVPAVVMALRKQKLMAE